MFGVLSLAVLLFLSISWCVWYVTMEKRKKKLLTASTKIPLETVMIFSLSELVSRLKRYYGKEGRILLIEFADDKWIDINTKEKKLTMLNILDSVQEFMISKRYNPDDEYVIKEYINSVMYDIWLDYAYKNNYKILFWREMNRRFAADEISISFYNEVCNRFYKYKNP